MKPDKKDKDKKLLWRIHHWAGLYTGIIIGILCFTGALAVFIPEIDVLIQKNYYSVSALPSVPGDLPRINNALTETKKQYPNMSGLLIDMPEKPGQIATFSFQVKGKQKSDNKNYSLFVDPVRDKVLGDRDRQNSFVNYLRQIHVRLYEGFWGRQLVGLGGIAFIIVTITGFLIYGKFMKKQSYPKIRRKNTRIWMADWHKILGISALAFNFVIACSGAWLGLQPKLMTWFDIKAPNDYQIGETVDPKEDAKIVVDWDKVFKVVKQEFPELKPGYVRPSEDGTATVEVHGSVEGQVYEKNINTIVLEKNTYKPVFKFDLRNASFRDRFYSAQEALHFGDFGGLGLKIVYTILGLVSSFLSISGFVVYLYRTDKKENRMLSPLKTVFIYSMIILFILTIIALISMFIGYRQAATLAAYIINGGLTIFLVYVIWKYVAKKFKTKPTLAG
ncbi:MAG: PepSY domain-containing protein [Chryseobacterium sp.]|nr:MAG: PepSY domain-containing protein [Chryseobacterium sp.]